MVFSCPVPGRFLLVSTGHREMGSCCWERVGTRQEELGSWFWERGDRVLEMGAGSERRTWCWERGDTVLEMRC